jgi:VIT1/CCC1 family predicted Fe2+/Mn2+ transporter
MERGADLCIEHNQGEAQHVGAVRALSEDARVVPAKGRREGLHDAVNFLTLSLKMPRRF